MQAQVIFDFNKKSNLQDWIIVDDVVMGGRSSSTFKLDKDGLVSLKGIYLWKIMADFHH